METTEYQPQGETFQIQGHDVVMLSPAMVRITIHCPWPPPHLNQKLSPTQQEFIMNKTQWIVNYMLAEGILIGNGMGVNVMVETQHPKN